MPLLQAESVRGDWTTGCYGMHIWDR